jgi:hypothetical protein
MEIMFTFIVLWSLCVHCMFVCDTAVVYIIVFFAFTDMFMKLQEDALPYTFSLLGTCATNTYYMLNRADKNSDHFKNNLKDPVISE